MGTARCSAPHEDIKAEMLKILKQIQPTPE